MKNKENKKVIKITNILYNNENNNETFLNKCFLKIMMNLSDDLVRDEFTGFSDHCILKVKEKLLKMNKENIKYKKYIKMVNDELKIRNL